MSTTLSRAAIPLALGGSGLLLAYGLAKLDTPPRDWDLTTDADPETVAAALAPFHPERVEPNGPFATAAMFRFAFEGARFDIMCRFAIRYERGVWRFPTIIDGQWHGVPLSRLEPWLVAYMLLGREGRAAVIRAYLWRAKPAVEVIREVDAGLLPERVRQSLRELAGRG